MVINETRDPIILGIDLGTTNSLMAMVGESGLPEIIKSPEGGALVPSVVYFGPDGPIVGEEAKAMQAGGEEAVASFFKRSIGNREFEVTFGSNSYSAIDLSALVLQKLKTDAEAYLGQEVSQAVVTVPASFNHAQREDTIKAAAQAGINVTDLINEPTAAALAYGADRTDEGSFLVYDLGGGTFDVTILAATESQLSVLATGGDSQLGGKNWDDCILNLLASRFTEEFGDDPLEDRLSFNDLLVASEVAKRALTERETTNVSIYHQGHQGRYEFSRELFEECTADLMERTRDLTASTLKAGGIEWSGLTGVLLVGGSTRMPMVRRYVREMSGEKPLSGINVDEAIALGAALKAATSRGTEVQSSKRFYLPSAKILKDVTSHSLGLVAESVDRSRYVSSRVILKNTEIPASATEEYAMQTRSSGPNFCEVYVTQGEDDIPSRCLFLGKYVISDIPHGGGGVTKLDITYRYDANGLADIEAVVQSSGEALPVSHEQLPDDMSWVDSPPPELTTAVETQPVEVCLLIDVSGSMSGNPLQEAKSAANAFVDKCEFPRIMVSVVSFETDSHRHCRLSADPKAVQSAIGKLSIGGGTNMSAGLDEAGKTLGSNGQRFIVLMTDGEPNSQEDAITSANRLKNSGIDIVAIGTSGADRRYLKMLASTEEGSIFTGIGSLVETFSTIAQIINTGGDQIRGSIGKSR